MTTAAITPKPRKRPAARLPQKMTAAKFPRFRPEDGYKYEWVNGQIQKTPRSMTPEQQYIVHNLQRRFTQTEAYRAGADLVVETDSTMQSGNIRRPDISLMTAPQRKAAAFGVVYCPAFAIEVISENDHINKVVEKLDEYFRSGVQVVWHIFPKFQRVNIYHSPKKVQVMEGEDLCSAAPIVPDFNLAAADIFKI